MEFTDEIGCTLIQACASDILVVNAARVSFNKESTHMGEREIGLVGFLMRNHHGTPFEHNMFTFLVEVPLFVAREHHRHRIGHSYNEWSARYSKMEPKFYVPTYVRTQEGKPGAYSFEELSDPAAQDFRDDLEYQCKKSYKLYEQHLENGVAKEQARYFLHTNTFTKFFWTCNARSLMHFIGLRNHPAAMWEISKVAQAAEQVLEREMPVTHAAFEEFGRTAP